MTTIAPGQVIDGKYSITRLIGEGGMGAVYEGVNTRIRRRVAIKVLLTSAKDAAGTVVERFEREAQAAGCIGSDHILEVLDLGTLESGDRYMVMEYLDGESLADRIRRMGQMTPEQIAPLLRQSLVGLDAAHAAGIVHRDLKPDNIFILKEKAGRPDFIKLIDFGISKFNALTGDMSMTRTGAVMGTPYYMSPEQAKGAGSVNHQTDLYSIGVIAFEALTGRVPFDGETFNDLMFKIVLSDMPDLETEVPGIDPAFAAIVRRAMSREMSQRFQSAQEFIAALDAWSPSLSVRPVQQTLSGASSQTLGGEARASSAQFGTNLDWAASQAEEAAVPKKKPPVALYAAAAAVLILGGGVFALVSGGEEEPTSALAPEVAATEAEAPPVPEQKPAVEPPPATPPAEEKPAEKKQEKDDPAPSAKEPERDEKKAAKAPATSTTSTTASKPATSTSTKPATSTPTSSSTTKSTSKAPTRPSAPDFGY